MRIIRFLSDLRYLRGLNVFHVLRYYFELRKWVKRYGVISVDVSRYVTLGIACVAIRNGRDPRDVAWALLQ